VERRRPGKTEPALDLSLQLLDECGLEMSMRDRTDVRRRRAKGRGVAKGLERPRLRAARGTTGYGPLTAGPRNLTAASRNRHCARSTRRSTRRGADQLEGRPSRTVGPPPDRCGGSFGPAAD
jgi:hypothetical protein